MKSFRLVRKIFLIAAILSAPGILLAQKGVEDGSKYGHGEDSVRCIRALTISHEFAKDRDYETALPHWKIIFDECPLASKNIYIDGVKIYKDKLKKNSSTERFPELIDTLMLVYERRIQYFGEKGNVRGRQGVDLLRYGRDKIEYVEMAYGFLKESMELDKAKARDAVLASFFSSSLVLFNKEIINVEDVINDYLFVSELIDAKIVKKPNDRDLVKLKESTDQNFLDQGPGSCIALIDFFGPQFEAQKTDAEYLDLVFTMLKTRDCKDSELFYNVLTAMESMEPSAKLSEEIAAMAAENGDYTTAITYYENAVKLDSIEDNKADYYFGIAKCYKALDNKPQCRTFSRKALSIKPNWGDPYLLIGQLYAESDDLCSSLKLPKSIYWVAVDMFEKARSVDPTAEERARTLINAYSQRYPTADDAFFQGINNGDSYTVDCWINETTRARF